jgi:hypothetical protein
MIIQFLAGVKDESIYSGKEYKGYLWSIKICIGNNEDKLHIIQILIKLL